MNKSHIKLLKRKEYSGKPVPLPHPVMEKYHWTMGDIYYYSIAIGVAPPVLFGIVTGRIRSNTVINEQLSTIIDAGDVQSMMEDYDPYRHMKFIDSIRDTVTIRQRYLVSLLQPGDAIKTDDGRWLVVSHVTEKKKICHIFSSNVYVATLRKDSMITVAIGACDVHNSSQTPYSIDKVHIKNARKKFFSSHFDGNYDFKELYNDIMRNITDDELKNT